MITASFLWCILFFKLFDVSSGYEDPFILPECENKGPDDVYLNFSNEHSHEISRSLIIESAIKCLNYEGNHIRDIDTDTFDDVPDLYYLNLAGNPIMLENFIKTKLPNLKTLILDAPSTCDRPDYELHPYSNFFDPSEYANIHEYGGTTFSLPELKKLSLCDYGTHYSKRAHFLLVTLYVPMLTHLYLSGNQLDEIPNLAKMPYLTHLNFNDNEMVYMPGTLLQNLEYLSVERNNIVKVCGTICTLRSISPHKMRNLKYLSLADNNIDLIDSDAFANSENLLVLNLAGNKIYHFEENTFDNMAKLQNLTLDRNNLTRVPDVSALHELQVLSLDENKIMVIDQMAFADMPNLCEVYLRKNRVTTIADMAFGSLPSLTILDLSWNKIDFLPDDWILPSNSLKILHLDGNEFTDLRNLTLEQLQDLNVLGLAYNPIKKISVRSLMKLAADVVIDVTLDSSVRTN